MSRTAPRRFVWLLAAATLIPIGVLSWLGFRIVQQDRDAEMQRQNEALDVDAGRLALDIERRLQDIEADLARGTGIVLTANGPQSSPAFPLLYQASYLPGESRSSPALAEAQVAEHQRKDLVAATAAYREAARSRDREVRGAALLGLGSVLTRQGNSSGALRAWAELEALDRVTVAGQPAGLLARLARCRALDKAGESARLKTEALEFARVLYQGGWRIDRPTFENFQEELGRWGAPAAAIESVARTASAVRLWEIWRANELLPAGRNVIIAGGAPVLAIWTGGPARPVAWFASSADLSALFNPVAATHALRVSGQDGEGNRLFGEPGSKRASLMQDVTRLPFVLSVAPMDDTPADARDRSRQLVLVASLSTAFLLMLGAGYGLYRATTRELALAKQQTDFVSAVSHEFRTPLTSMRHLTDLLATRGVESEERRGHYYALLANETERLHRMVESLLSFGRIEAGAYAWRLEPVDPGALMAQSVEEFRAESIAKGREITCDIEPDLPGIQADAEALSRAVWNLLENAAKYSAPDAPIRAFARRHGQAVHLGIGDCGIGIEPGERDTIFQKFVRGAGTTRAGIRGVGIGLALVKRIAEAHGGSVRLDSEPGRGSTFTLVIPCPES